MKKILLFALALLLSGCATAPVIMPPQQALPPGTYHRIEKGQTLWRLSKIYNCGLDELIKINKITDTSNIEIGQMILIPEPLAKPSHPIAAATADFKASNEDFICPVKGRIILPFGQTSNNLLNKGVNIKPGASADVRAARSGKVVFYNPALNGWGKTIIIDHGEGLSTLYARNKETYVKVGDVVAQAAVIAKVGAAGRDQEEYLHFEIRKRHIPQNPLFYLSEGR